MSVKEDWEKKVIEEVKERNLEISYEEKYKKLQIRYNVAIEILAGFKIMFGGIEENSKAEAELIIDDFISQEKLWN
jgi:hypothetical protein